jgi:G3E family GTPase
MSEVNIDADLIRDGDANLSRTDETLVEMTNGCICCTLRDDLLAEVRKLAEEGRFDYLLIESTGISEPLPVAATFDFRDEQGRSLSDVARLDTMVTVVDAAHLLRDYASEEFIRERGEHLGDDDNRTLVDLLVDQIEFADVIILNKISAASRRDAENARQIVRALNPDARILETDFANVAPAAVLNTGLFDFEKAQQNPIWYKELYGFGEHVPEAEEYGVSSFVYRARRPFHPERFQQFIRSGWPGVIRAKGHFWIATRPEWVGELSQAGAIVRNEGMGYWWAAVPKERWPDHPEWRERVTKNWDPVYGDRRQEIVFIGIGLDKEAIERRLDACLIEPSGAEKLDIGTWRKLPDPFPAWHRAAA